jgi:hypothetical protein
MSPTHFSVTEPGNRLGRRTDRAGAAAANVSAVTTTRNLMIDLT